MNGCFLMENRREAGIPGGALCVSGAPPQCDLYAGQYRSRGGCAESLAYFVPDAAGAGQRMVFNPSFRQGRQILRIMGFRPEI